MRTARDIIIRPMLTEKTMTELEGTRYLYGRRPRNRVEIKKAAEEVFNQGQTLNTLKMPGKTRRMDGSKARPEWKKVVVTLEEGHTIPL